MRGPMAQSLKSDAAPTLSANSDQLHLKAFANKLNDSVHIVDVMQTNGGILLPALELRLSHLGVRGTITDDLHKGAETDTRYEILLKILDSEAARLEIGVDPSG